MIAFGHTAVGAIIGVVAYETFGQTADPYTGLLATGAIGMVSHYLMDFVPHGHFFKPKHYKKNIWAVIIFDLLLSVGATLLLSNLSFGLSLKWLYVLFGIGGSQLPDILDGLIYIGVLPNVGPIRWENSFHQATHWHGREEKTRLLSLWDLWQVAVAILAAVLILKTF